MLEYAYHEVREGITRMVYLALFAAIMAVAVALRVVRDHRHRDERIDAQIRRIGNYGLHAGPSGP